VIDSTGNCFCITSTYFLGGTCRPCVSRCLVCANPFCTQCLSGYLNIAGACSKACEPMLEYFDTVQGVCLPACPRGSYYEITNHTCVRGRPSLSNSTSFFYNISAETDPISGEVLRNRFVVSFSKPPRFLNGASFVALFRLFLDDTAESYSLVNNTATDYIIEILPSRNYGYPSIDLLLLQQQLIVTASD
jgi:hypothetical protein